MYEISEFNLSTVFIVQQLVLIILHLLTRLIQVNSGSMCLFHVLKIKSNRIPKGPKSTLGDACP